MSAAHSTSKPAPPLPGPEKLPYFNRELSWLAFNRRVLLQAFRQDNPLLERLKFLSIVSSNLDEFFEIRVAGLIQQVDSGIKETSMDGLGPKEQLRRIHSVVASLVEDQYRCWHKELVPALRRERILFKTADELNAAELKWIRNYFDREVFPVLTPLAFDPAHPFPHLGNKTLNVLASIRSTDDRKEPRRMVIVPVPRILPRVVEIDPGRRPTRKFIFLSEIIKLCASTLFPGCEVVSAKAFRITRNSDLYIDEEEAENLLKKIEEELRNLRRGAAVRLEIEEGVDEALFQRLLEQVNLPMEYVFRINGPINLLRLMSVYNALDRSDLKDPSLEIRPGIELAEQESIFDRIDAGDLLLHHPYESFQPVVDFVREAARDPTVFAIKQTLYRTSGDSPIIRSLIEASQNGKQVTALIELKARFDEANNIQWAKQMEEAGVHVVYGVVGLKIHCKCCLIVRRTPRGIKHYLHLGTGNYNPKTATTYTDFSYFTARDEITREVASLFNSLTGYGKPRNFDALLVAPYNLHDALIRLIETEAANARAGQPARIIAQINSLIDRSTMNALYEASRAGVTIDLVVRGICGLVPGIPGLSENIRVRSIVGRFLEHVRAFYFVNHGGDPKIYLGSSDWMPRNFYRRVEVVFPLFDPKLQERILTDYFPTLLRDTANSRILSPSGAYLPLGPETPDCAFSAHAWFADGANGRRPARGRRSTTPSPRTTTAS
ncbi:MAG: polyphosphate kinase 1 [Puniceicoccaceae bacterium]|nr:MAG: polyphosphate kinase 1 [Puniceicoccaceae bacterium]